MTVPLKPSNGVQIGSKRNANRPSYVATDFQELAPLKHKLSEAEANGQLTGRKEVRMRSRKSKSSSKSNNTNLMTKAVAHVSAPDTHTLFEAAPAPVKPLQTEAEIQAEEKRLGRGRRTNVEQGLAPSAYQHKLEKRAEKLGVTVDELREHLRSARRIGNKPVGDTQLTAAEAVANAVVSPLAAKPAPQKAPKKMKTSKVSLQSLLPPTIHTAPVQAEESVVTMPVELDKTVKQAEMLSTTDYSIFSFKDTNRKVTQSGKDAMVKAIQANNLLHLNPILVDSNMQIVNGQHRYLAAKELGVPLYYFIQDVTDEQMLSLSGAQKSLTLKDYLDSYVKQGKAEYIKVHKFIEEHKVALGSAISLLSNRNSVPNGELMDNFKAGTFKVQSIEHAERLLAIREVVHEVGKEFFATRSFTNAIAQVAALPDFDEDRMINKIKSLGFGKLHQAPTTQLYTGQLLDIYNTNLPKPKHLKLA